MSKLLNVVLVVIVVFGMSLVIIPGVGIDGGLGWKHIVQPFWAWVTDPGPTYVDDPRCCR